MRRTAQVTSLLRMALTIGSAGAQALKRLRQSSLPGKPEPS